MWFIQNKKYKANIRYWTNEYSFNISNAYAEPFVIRFSPEINKTSRSDRPTQFVTNLCQNV